MDTRSNRRRASVRPVTIASVCASLAAGVALVLAAGCRAAGDEDRRAGASTGSEPGASTSAAAAASGVSASSTTAPTSGPASTDEPAPTTASAPGSEPAPGSDTAAVADLAPTSATPPTRHERRMAMAVDGQQLAYELHLPTGAAPKEGWPLLLFLHGAGERGDDLARVAVHGPPKLVATEPTLWGCVLVAPQCPADAGWQASTLLALLDEVQADLASAAPVDPPRLHVTELSMGGFGTFELLATQPERFASALAICGGMRASRIDAIANAHAVPVRVVHGSADRVVPLSSSERVVERLRAAGGSVEFTVLDGVDHDSWTSTYADPETWIWLLGARRAEPE